MTDNGIPEDDTKYIPILDEHTRKACHIIAVITLGGWILTRILT